MMVALSALIYFAGLIGLWLSYDLRMGPPPKPWTYFDAGPNGL